MIHIPHIIFEFVRPGNGISTMALCPSGDARTHFMPAGLLLGIQWQVLHQQWPGPNQGHIALQHIDQLGKFINGGGAHKTSHLGQPFFIRQQIAVLIPFVGHRLEFDDLENFCVFTWAFLQKKGSCTFVGEMQPNGYNQQKRRNDYQGY